MMDFSSHDQACALFWKTRAALVPVNPRSFVSEMQAGNTGSTFELQVCISFYDERLF